MARKDTKRDVFTHPEGLSGYNGDLTADQAAHVGPAPTTASGSAASNRGMPAAQEGSGAVTGSGAGAGGSGTEEEYNRDPQGGGGKINRKHPDEHPMRKADAPAGGSL